MNIRSIKKENRKNLKKYLWPAILVCFIVTTIISGGYKYNSKNNIGIANQVFDKALENSNLSTIETLLDNIDINIFDNLLETPTRGVLSVFVNQITGTGSFVIGVLNVINQFIFKNSVPVLITLIIGLIIYLLFVIFAQNIFIVGKNRYFIEQQKYIDTPIDKVLFVYRVRKTMNVAKIMFFKVLYSFLWDLTIIGGFIKHYEYSMIPYILAENPTINKKDCFKLSKEMTNGYKFTLFKLDISFIGWYLFGGITLGISNIFYFHPYKESVYASIYMNLRSNILNDYKELFKDRLLDGERSQNAYPNSEYFIPELKARKWLKFDYNIDYSYLNLILIFFTFAMIGWIWEVCLHLFNEGVFVNRGTMFGPWLPIYGWGGLLILVLLKPFREKPWHLFLTSFTLCGIIEYFTAWYLETFKGMKWWDYTGYFLNLDGRVCLEGLLVFGLAGLIGTYVLGPLLNNIFNKLKNKIKISIVIVLVLLFSCDLVYSHYHINTGKGITTEIKSVK